jgi:predicted Fe-Mo cluster-binding NifX family protein
MKIAVSATGGSIHAKVEERFGRAPYYVVVDSETMRFGLVSNPSVTSEHGAGPQAASLLHDRGVTVVLTGRVGPNARRALEALEMKLVENTGGTVEAAVKAFLGQTSSAPSTSGSRP